MVERGEMLEVVDVWKEKGKLSTFALAKRRSSFPHPFALIRLFVTCKLETCQSLAYLGHVKVSKEAGRNKMSGI